MHFYDCGFEYLGALQRYFEIEYEEPYSGESPEEKKGRQSKFFDDEVSGRLKDLKTAAQKAEGALLRVKSTLN